MFPPSQQAHVCWTVRTEELLTLLTAPGACVQQDSLGISVMWISMIVSPILVSMVIVRTWLLGTLVSVIPSGRVQTVIPVSSQTVHDVTARWILQCVYYATQDSDCQTVRRSALRILVRMVVHALLRDQVTLPVCVPGVGLVLHAQCVLKVWNIE